MYKGKLRDGQMVAVKKLDRGTSAGDKQFDIEVNLLNMMRHPNIVRLLGICTEGHERMAVLEFASKVRLTCCFHCVTTNQVWAVVCDMVIRHAMHIFLHITLITWDEYIKVYFRRCTSAQGCTA